jgi:MerR family transcriptional regulator, copper efflux regulator
VSAVDGHMQIGQVAARTELSIQTVRHYDEVGLVVPSARSAGGFRLYTDDDVQRLLTIRRMKPLGFSLAEMKDLLDSFDVLDDARTTRTQRGIASERLAELVAQVRQNTDKLRRHLAYAEELHALLEERIAGSGADA